MRRRGGARPGAGRPARDPKHNRRPLSTTVSYASWQQLRTLAARMDKSVSEVLDELIALAVTHPAIAELLDGVELVEDEVGASFTAEQARCAQTVLVVEDDVCSLELLRVRLEHLGCEVLVADDPEAAYELAVARRPALVILDLELYDDKQAGLELLHRLRATPETATIPIAIHSVYVRHESELPEALPAVEGLLPKPFKRKDLVELIAAYCEAEDDDRDVAVL